MVFTPPGWVADIPYEVPEKTLIADFVFDDEAWPGFTEIGTKGKLVCASTGTSLSLQEISNRVELLARSLSHDLNWEPGKGSSWDKVVGVFSLNADRWHLSTATRNKPGIRDRSPHETRVYILDVPGILKPSDGPGATLCSVETLIAKGNSKSSIEPINWNDEDGAERVAYLCPTSGTSGVQKLSIVTHRGFIANMMQGRAFEEAAEKRTTTGVGLGILPLTHSYGLIVAQAMLWRGDTLILHSRFEMQAMLKSIMQYKIDRLYLIPPILAALANNTFLLDICDISSVKSIVTGAGGLSKELNEKLRTLRPGWVMLSGYGLTEAAVMVSLTSTRSLLPGSSGILLPRYRARLVDLEGHDIEQYDKPGELLLQTPSVMKGYLGDEEATKASFESAGWLRTGDVGLFRPASDGTEHLFIVDRLKDMIQVKGIQVVPTDIETCLRNHPGVADVAVVAVKDPRDGERAKAFIIRSKSEADQDEAALKKAISKHVEENMTEPHWLHRRVEFVDEFPRSQAGKILKYKLRTVS